MRNIGGERGANSLFLPSPPPPLSPFPWACGYRDTDCLIVKLCVLATVMLDAVINRHTKTCNGSNKTGSCNSPRQTKFLVTGQPPWAADLGVPAPSVLGCHHPEPHHSSSSHGKGRHESRGKAHLFLKSPSLKMGHRPLRAELPPEPQQPASPRGSLCLGCEPGWGEH